MFIPLTENTAKQYELILSFNVKILRWYSDTMII